MTQPIRTRTVLHDFISRKDRLNPPVRTPKQDRTFDRALLLVRAAILCGLGLVLINVLLNLLTGD